MAERKGYRIRVPGLARVEGEGALEIDVQDGAITHLALRIFEPPRLFEKFLEGHWVGEVPDLVARICGICPVAYQMTAVHALERLFECDPGPWVAAMRRLFYCGEWIQSHALHIHLLAAPDFFGVDSVTGLMEREPEAVKRGFALQRAGNEILALLGARSVHPVGARLGGFHRAPAEREVEALLLRLEALLPEAEETVAWCASLQFPQVEQRFVSVALEEGERYPFNGGRILSSEGLAIDPLAWPEHFEEHQVPHSTALHATLHGRSYLVGPLARLNLARHRLPPRAAAALEASGIAFPSANLFHSIVARAVELLAAMEEAVELLRAYRPPEGGQPAREWRPRAGVAAWATEAPRGVLWHRYEVDGEGRVVAARIVPPTSQNQGRMEEDLRLSLEALGVDAGEEAVRHRAEQVVRNYDPCISCATHFLRVRLTWR